MNYRLGVIGYPVKHSLSPWIHNRLLNIADLEGKYNVIEINPDHFSMQLLELKNKKINGFNVTVPYKEKIIPYLDEIDDEARVMGAVNTVLQKRSEEHTSELQSRFDIVCRLLLENKNIL